MGAFSLCQKRHKNSRPSGYRGLLTQIGNLIVCTKGNGDLAHPKIPTKTLEGQSAANHRRLVGGWKFVCISQARPGHIRHHLDLVNVLPFGDVLPSKI